MSPPASPAPAESWLELPEGRIFWLKGPCSIGRQPDNDLVLDLPTGATIVCTFGLVLILMALVRGLMPRRHRSGPVQVGFRPATPE